MQLRRHLRCGGRGTHPRGVEKLKGFCSEGRSKRCSSARSSRRRGNCSAHSRKKIAVKQVAGVADAVVSGTSLVVDQDVPSLRRAARVWRCRFVLRTATPTTAAPSVAVRTLLSSSCSIGTAAAPAVKLLLNCAGAVNGPIGVRGALLCLVFRSAP